jgi:hypothetical protein
MASLAPSAGLMKVLTTPAKVASALDWRRAGGSILTLNIHRDRIDLAVARHPAPLGGGRSAAAHAASSSSAAEARTLEPLVLGRKGRSVPDESRRRLAEIVRDHKVCAFVVAWPVQPDSGKMGYAAGRALWTIEELLRDPSATTATTAATTGTKGTGVISANRPVCLWDSVRTEQSPTDMWGRNPDFARTTDKTLHLASEEQYGPDEAIVVGQVWDDFMRANWPGILRHSGRRPVPPSSQEEEGKDNEQQHYVAFGDDEESAYSSAATQKLAA